MKDFFENLTAEHFIGRTTGDCFKEYAKWCVANDCDIAYCSTFGRELYLRYNIASKQKRVPGGRVLIYAKKKEN